MSREREPRKRPNELPPELAEFLRGQEFACVTQATDRGTVFVVKAPAREIQSLRGRVPIHLSQELYDHPNAPVIRLVFTISDQPERPLALETCVHVEDEQQRSDFAALADQDELHLLFYDERLRHRLSKGIRNLSREEMAEVLGRADRLYAAIPKERFNFDRAKADV